MKALIGKVDDSPVVAVILLLASFLSAPAARAENASQGECTTQDCHGNKVSTFFEGIYDSFYGCKQTDERKKKYTYYRMISQLMPIEKQGLWGVTFGDPMTAKQEVNDRYRQVGRLIKIVRGTEDKPEIVRIRFEDCEDRDAPIEYLKKLAYPF